MIDPNNIIVSANQEEKINQLWIALLNAVNYRDLKRVFRIAYAIRAEEKKLVIELGE